MLTQFAIDNFKSLVDFKLPNESDESLGHFVCLIGLNGSGKSSVLQAIDFVSQLAVGDVDKWLASRGWTKSEIVTKGSRKRNITFSLKFEVEQLGVLTWSGAFNSLQGRCTREELKFEPSDDLGLEVVSGELVHFVYEGGILKEQGGWRREVLTEFSGSVFNKLRNLGSGLDSKRANIIIVLRYFLLGVKSLELLSPHSMRRSSKSAVDVGLGGENLAAFIGGLSGAEREELLTELVKFNPRLEKVTSKTGKYGWKRFVVSERYDSAIELDARHVNDGLLRIVAIVAQTVARSAAQRRIMQGPDVVDEASNPSQKGYQFILLDEIENGINPEVVERLVGYLLRVRQQVFVTTHSPLILNYLPDDVARKSVFLICRETDGSSRAKRFFDIPALSNRLRMMGPGEAFLDVKLEEVSINS